MRKRIWLVCLVGAAICLLLVLKPNEPQRVGGPKITELPSRSAAQPQQPNRPKQAIVGFGSNDSTTPSVPRLDLAKANPRYSNALADALLSKWQTPIEFYGKVIDEADRVVSDATAVFSWAEAPTKDGNRITNVQSDADGLFSLHGAQGPSLTVLVTKPGYVASARGLPEFKYGPFSSDGFRPDRNAPVIFHLRKRGQSVALNGLKQNYPIPRDGTPVSVDLTSGKSSMDRNGDFVVQCWTEDNGKTSGQKYDWHCRLTVPGGGIALTDEEFPFLAPASGYKPSVDIAMSAGRADWTSDVSLKFFYRLNDGLYGRMVFAMIARGHHFFMLDSLLNPDGSQNLEPMELGTQAPPPPPGMTAVVPDFK